MTDTTQYLNELDAQLARAGMLARKGNSRWHRNSIEGSGSRIVNAARS